MLVCIHDVVYAQHVLVDVKYSVMVLLTKPTLTHTRESLQLTH